jgi:hypothetical protein
MGKLSHQLLRSEELLDGDVMFIITTTSTLFSPPLPSFFFSPVDFRLPLFPSSFCLQVR